MRTGYFHKHLFQELFQNNKTNLVFTSHGSDITLLRKFDILGNLFYILQFRQQKK